MTKRFRTSVWMGMLTAGALLGGCPMPPPASNGNGANVNANAANENVNAPANQNANAVGANENVNEPAGNVNGGANANENSPVNGGANENSNTANANANADANQNSNAANANANANTNANTNANSNNNTNTNGTGGTGELSDAERAAVQQFAVILRESLVGPAALQGFAQPQFLDFEALGQIGSVSGCPTVSWAHNLTSGIGVAGLIFESSGGGVGACNSAALAGLAADGELQFGSITTATGQGTFSTPINLLVNGALLDIAGQATADGGGAQPVRFVGTLTFTYGAVVLQGPVTIDATRAGVVTLSGQNLTVSDGSAVFAASATNLRLQPLNNGSFVPDGGTVVIERGADPAITVEFLTTSPGNGIVRVSEGAGTPIDLQVFQ